LARSEKTNISTWPHAPSAGAKVPAGTTSPKAGWLGNLEHIKEYINDLLAAFRTAAGHTHTGVDGDGPQIPLASGVSGILPAANGGTGSQYFAVAGPTAERTYTFPDANTTLGARDVSINEQTDSYTLVLADADKLIDMNKATAVTLTVPPNSSVAFATGTQILVRQKGAGQVTVSPGSGVTIQAANSNDKTVAQHSLAGLIKVATDTWLLFGDITT